MPLVIDQEASPKSAMVTRRVARPLPRLVWPHRNGLGGAIPGRRHELPAASLLSSTLRKAPKNEAQVSSGYASSHNEMQDQRDYGKQQQQMDQATRHVKHTKAGDPGNQQNNEQDRPEAHTFAPSA